MQTLLSVIHRVHLLVLLFGTQVMMYVMAKTGAPLKTGSTPNGIIDLEFAYSASSVKNIIAAWTTTEGGYAVLHAAKLNTWLDFLFLLFYSLFLYRVCRYLAFITTYPALASTGNQLARAALIAGAMDILENGGMLLSLYNYPGEVIPLFTVTCSLIKWLLLITVVLYVIIAGAALIFSLVKRKFTNQHP